MDVKKTNGFVLYPEPLLILIKGKLDYYKPPTIKSKNWKHWVAYLDIKTCKRFRDKHGEIYAFHSVPAVKPPLHTRCRCQIEPMDAVFAGNGTKDGQNGADWWLKQHGILPGYSIDMQIIIGFGWSRGKSPAININLSFRLKS